MQNNTKIRAILGGLWEQIKDRLPGNPEVYRKQLFKDINDNVPYTVSGEGESTRLQYKQKDLMLFIDEWIEKRWAELHLLTPAEDALLKQQNNKEQSL